MDLKGNLRLVLFILERWTVLVRTRIDLFLNTYPGCWSSTGTYIMVKGCSTVLKMIQGESLRTDSLNRSRRRCLRVWYILCGACLFPACCISRGTATSIRNSGLNSETRTTTLLAKRKGQDSISTYHGTKWGTEKDVYCFILRSNFMVTERIKLKERNTFRFDNNVNCSEMAETTFVIFGII